MSRAQMSAEMIRTSARSLKMPGVVRAFEELARQARQEGWSVEEYLGEILSAELLSREQSVIAQRLASAHFPERKTLDTFDFDAAEGVDRSKLLELARGGWLDRKENVLLVGPIGTGKTHLAIALGIEAAKQRKRVVFHRTAELVRMLLEARDARELGSLQRRLNRVELLVLDELGFVPFDRPGGELLFNLLAERYERSSVLITSNLAFGEWPKVFGDDEKLTTALLDRLAHHATVVPTRGKSFRMQKRTRSESEKA